MHMHTHTHTRTHKHAHTHKHTPANTCTNTPTPTATQTATQTHNKRTQRDDNQPNLQTTQIPLPTSITTPNSIKWLISDLGTGIPLLNPTTFDLQLMRWNMGEFSWPLNMSINFSIGTSFDGWQLFRQIIRSVPFDQKSDYPGSRDNCPDCFAVLVEL